MVCRHQLVLLVNVCTLPLGTHDNTILCPFKVLEQDLTETFFRSLNGRLTVSPKYQI